MISYLAVALGGAIGASARFALGSWLVAAPGRFPLATFCANGLGCLLMGALYLVIVERHIVPLPWRPFLMIGVLGAFTTFSTFAIETLTLWQNQQPGLAAVYVIASVVLSLIAVWAGYTASAFIFQQ